MQGLIDDHRHLYLLAKCRVTAAGFGHEITWQKDRSAHELSERDVLAEAAWVILSGGMRERVIRGLFPRVSEAFYDWSSAKLIWSRRRRCVTQALRTFNHRGKLNAIVTFARVVAQQGHNTVLWNMHNQGPEYLRRFPYLGPATARHLAKNLGCDVAKPDRHLLRIAAVLHYNSPSVLCSALASAAGDSVAVVNLVLWRFATIEPDYLRFFGSAGATAALAA